MTDLPDQTHMARIVEPSPEDIAAYQDWVAGRPPIVRAVAERFEPWSLYRMKSTGQKVTIAAIAEDGTVRVDVRGEYNLTLFERSVFGVDPNDLEPCDLPPPDEVTGALMTSDDVEQNLDAIRVHVRPDLWRLDANGKAVRR